MEVRGASCYSNNSTCSNDGNCRMTVLIVMIEGTIIGINSSIRNSAN